MQWILLKLEVIFQRGKSQKPNVVAIWRMCRWNEDILHEGLHKERIYTNFYFQVAF